MSTSHYKRKENINEKCNLIFSTNLVFSLLWINNIIRFVVILLWCYVLIIVMIYFLFGKAYMHVHGYDVVTITIQSLMNIHSWNSMSSSRRDLICYFTFADCTSCQRKFNKQLVSSLRVTLFQLEWLIWNLDYVCLILKGVWSAANKTVVLAFFAHLHFVDALTRHTNVYAL